MPGATLLNHKSDSGAKQAAIPVLNIETGIKDRHARPRQCNIKIVIAAKQGDDHSKKIPTFLCTSKCCSTAARAVILKQSLTLPFSPGHSMHCIRQPC